MRIPIGRGRPRGMQDVLRSVGAMLDLVGARLIIIREDRDTIAVRAHVAPTLNDRIEGRWSPLERALSREDLATLRAQAVARRGTGHVAGPRERSLRMVGRHIDERSLRDVHLIEYGDEDGWLLWHHDTPHQRPALILLEGRAMRVAAATAAQERAAREALEASTLVGPRPRT